MNKSKKLRQIALITGIPGIIVFFITVLLLKLVETSKISSFVAIIILLIVCGGVVLGIIKLLSTLMNCFTDVSNNIDEIAEGKATIDFQYKAKNDATKELLEHVQSLILGFAKVTAGIKSATGNLGTVVSDFCDSFEEMSSMSENINKESRIIAENAKNQAGMTDDFTGRIEELGDSIDTIAAQTDALTKSANNMKECNTKADAIMEELVEISNQNGQAVVNINKQTQITNQSVQEIMEAVDIITSIAGQTNLLALNASIEAARAGEQGAGFAVVAEEIGKLAIQSRKSSEHIAQIVNSLINNSNENVEITKSLEEAFERQKKKIGETESIFSRLNNEVLSVSNSIIEIDHEADSAKKEGDVMRTQMVVLKETVETNMVSVENTVSELQGLEGMVGRCQELTQTITGISEELIGYIDEITDKKKQMAKEKR